jgi:hypothetical protein
MQRYRVGIRFIGFIGFIGLIGFIGSIGFIGFICKVLVDVQNLCKKLR